ncbi:TPA: hypothetical protein ACOEBF_000047 [Stenotrophomonas maltophilia]|uniref:hypothetical protein n=1 Tax=Stenotrophomonas maltophilia TaxID=40324 RepID=UPI00209AAACD|nr:MULTISPECIES: hypothetical protein [Stenotrophomonas]MCO7495976.1 hypothetical protein [Stenotrophomonas maltophilia]
MKQYSTHSRMLLDEQEVQLRHDHVEAWVAAQRAAGFGLDEHMANALHAYLDGVVELPELLSELRRPYLH